jgi:formylmethanofuran dehydrogenase subunit A
MTVYTGSPSPAATKKGTIYVEARLNSSNSLGIDADIDEWLRRYFLQFQIGQSLDMSGFRTARLTAP